MPDTPQINIGVVSNMYVRQMHFKSKGDIEYGHVHQFDHLSLLANGSVRIMVNGKPTEYVAPHMIFIKAEYEHELVALEDNTVLYCIHGLRDTNKSDDILDPLCIPEGVELNRLIDGLVISKNRFPEV